MMKNLILLGLLTWVSFTYAKHPVAQESMGEAESYKVDSPVKEQKAGRTFAGDKAKKERKLATDGAAQDEVSTGDSDSEVRYWRYSE